MRNSPVFCGWVDSPVTIHEAGGRGLILSPIFRSCKPFSGPATAVISYELQILYLHDFRAGSEVFFHASFPRSPLTQREVCKWNCGAKALRAWRRSMSFGSPRD